MFLSQIAAAEWVVFIALMLAVFTIGFIIGHCIGFRDGSDTRIEDRLNRYVGILHDK